jgi:hypothetical protein
MLPDLISLRKGVALLLLATCVDAFSCSLDVGSIHYDISPLSGLRVAEQKDTPTPPTTNDAMVRMDLCSEDGLQKEEGIDDRDQVSYFTIYVHSSLGARRSATMSTGCILLKEEGLRIIY